MKLLSRIGLVLMLFGIFMCVASLATVQFSEKQTLLNTLVWVFTIGAGLFIVFRDGDK